MQKKITDLELKLKISEQKILPPLKFEENKISCFEILSKEKDNEENIKEELNKEKIKNQNLLDKINEQKEYYNNITKEKNLLLNKLNKNKTEKSNRNKNLYEKCRKYALNV